MMKSKKLFINSLNQSACLLVACVWLFSACNLTKRTTGNNSKSPSEAVPSSYNTKAATLDRNTMAANYIGRYQTIAVAEMLRTGIPASIKLAQGILESSYGNSRLAAQGNNHFGIKCHSNWSGDTMMLKDDDRNKDGELIYSCFRKYNSADESYRAHSEFLQKPRYQGLFKLDPRDYRSWAYGLREAGYATAPDYPEKLIKIIEDFQLYRFDNPNAQPLPTPPGPVVNNPEITKPSQPSQPNVAVAPALPAEGYLNDTKFIRAYGKKSLYEIAGKYSVRVEDLLAYNELIGTPDKVLKEGTVIFLQKKRNYWHGEAQVHTAKPCETMYDISQLYGIQLSRLLSKNNMRLGEQPAPGAKVYLRKGLFESVPKPALRDTTNEWLKCNPENINSNIPVVKPPKETVFDGEITPNINNKPTSTVTTPPTANQGKTEIVIPPGAIMVPEDSFVTPMEPVNRPTSNPTTVVEPPTKPITMPTRQPSQPTQPVMAEGQFHTVAQGETLWAISRKYGTTVEAIQRLNGKTDTVIKPGDRLRVK